jgi:hypothetical protein
MQWVVLCKTTVHQSLHSILNAVTHVNYNSLIVCKVHSNQQQNTQTESACIQLHRLSVYIQGVRVEVAVLLCTIKNNNLLWCHNIQSAGISENKMCGYDKETTTYKTNAPDAFIYSTIIRTKYSLHWKMNLKFLFWMKHPPVKPKSNWHQHWQKIMYNMHTSKSKGRRSHQSLMQRN